MPLTEVNYANTCIYKLVCRDLSVTDCYVGSTTDMTKRKYSHKKSCLTNPERRVYAYINEHVRW